MFYFEAMVNGGRGAANFKNYNEFAKNKKHLDLVIMRLLRLAFYCKNCLTQYKCICTVFLLYILKL